MIGLWLFLRGFSSARSVHRLGPPLLCVLCYIYIYIETTCVEYTVECVDTGQIPYRLYNIITIHRWVIQYLYRLQTSVRNGKNVGVIPTDIVTQAQGRCFVQISGKYML